MTALAKIRSAGYAVSLVDGFIEISPAGNLTDDQRGYLRSHKSEIIAELEAEAANDSDHQLTDDQTQSITRWVCSLGGSEVTIAEELADVLEQCRNNPDALAYFMKRAEGTPPDTQSSPVMCIDCTHFQPIHAHAHGKGAGHCAAGVMPTGLVHWHDATKACGCFTAIPHQTISGI